MQNGFGKTKIPTIKQESDKNKQNKRVTEQHLTNRPNKRA